jgi:hypothetical protein
MLSANVAISVFSVSGTWAVNIRYKKRGPECCPVELLLVLDDRQIVHHRFWLESNVRLSTISDDFRRLINERLTLNFPLRAEEDVEVAVNSFNNTIQWAVWNATPEHTDTFNAYYFPLLIKKKIEKKETAENGTD